MPHPVQFATLSTQLLPQRRQSSRQADWFRQYAPGPQSVSFEQSNAHGFSQPSRSRASARSRTRRHYHRL